MKGGCITSSSNVEKVTVSLLLRTRKKKEEGRGGGEGERGETRKIVKKYLFFILIYLSKVNIK